MFNNSLDDRPERIDLGWIQNPAAPQTEKELDLFIASISEILSESLQVLERREDA